MNEMEQQIVGMISAAGDSKAKAFEALKKVKESKYVRLERCYRKQERLTWKRTRSRHS